MKNILGKKCISYYASDKSVLDGKNSYEFWMRGKLTRIICDKPFSRGDILLINKIEDVQLGTIIETTLVDEWEADLPVLVFVSGRIIYNKWANFSYKLSKGIEIIKTIEQILNDNYSIGFILLVKKTGKIVCEDTMTGNNFDIFLNLEWE